MKVETKVRVSFGLLGIILGIWYLKWAANLESSHFILTIIFAIGGGLVLYLLSEIKVITLRNRRFTPIEEVRFKFLELMFLLFTALFMFGAFLASYETFVVVSAPQLVPIEYGCLKENLVLDSEYASIMTVANFGGSLTNYQFQYIGNNFVFSPERYDEYKSSYTTKSHKIPKNEYRDKKTWYQIENSTFSTANYTINWFGYRNLRQIHSVSCCYNSSENSPLYKLVDCE